MVTDRLLRLTHAVLLHPTLKSQRCLPREINTFCFILGFASNKLLGLTVAVQTPSFCNAHEAKTKAASVMIHSLTSPGSLYSEFYRIDYVESSLAE